MAPRLLLVPSFTELEWGIRPELEGWAEVASFDMPGVGHEPIPAGIELDLDPSRAGELLNRWRDAGAERGLAEADGHGWERFIVVTDSHGTQTAVRLAEKRPKAVLGLAIGHASLSHGHEGPRAPMRAGIWDALRQLITQGNDAFVRYGIAQMTRGGIDEELADELLERFPDDLEMVSATIDALGREPEPIGDDLAALGLPMLLGKHEGCLARTDEGFEDIVAAFPEADTVICPETSTASPAFAEALRTFAEKLSRAAEK